MKSERQRTQDLNKLSAYLDNALTASQHEKLALRLANEPELRQRLEDLHRTKILLGRLPRLQAPRHFTLTPEMVTVHRQKRQPFTTMLRLTSALAAVLLVVLFGVERLLSIGLQPDTLTAEAPMMEAAVFADEATPVPLIQWGVPGACGYGGNGEVDGLGGDTIALEEAMPEIQEEALPEMETEDLPEAELEPQITEEQGLLEVEDQAAEEKNLILGINPEQGGKVISRSEPAVQDQEPPVSRIDLIQWVQIALAVIAAGGGITLWFLHRRHLS